MTDVHRLGFVGVARLTKTLEILGADAPSIGDRSSVSQGHQKVLQHNSANELDRRSLGHPSACGLTHSRRDDNCGGVWRIDVRPFVRRTATNRARIA
jgi:hypothetical protein